MKLSSRRGHISAILLSLSLAARAQPIQPEVLVTFNSTNGSDPCGPLLQVDDGSFYGTTKTGGSRNWGTVFQITTNGQLTTIVSFDPANGNGSDPTAGLTLYTNGDLYSTTQLGTVFSLTTNDVLTTLASVNGASSYGLTLGNDGNFYSVTLGTVFRITPDGSLINLVNITNTDAYPTSTLTLGNDGSFYGTTSGGGNLSLNDGRGDGTVFRVTTNGEWAALVAFSGTNGMDPVGGVTLASDGDLYGTTGSGGDNGGGTVFKLTTNGLLTTLVSFKETGANYAGPLIVGSDGNFYGTTANGGSSNNGTVFQVTTNGILSTLVSFNGTNGASPIAGVIQGRDGDFYGTTLSGGASTNGVVFRVRHGAYIQSFGMATNGFALNALNVGGSGMVVLESSPDLNIWTPIQTNGPAAAQQFLDAGAPARPQMFYRLVQQ